MYYIFYNEKAGGGSSATALAKLKEKLNDYQIYSVTKEEGGVNDILAKLTKDDKIILVGGDGTYSYFLNHYKVLDNELILVSGGTGNDLLRNYLNSDHQDFVNYTKNVDKVRCLVDDKEIIVVNGVGAGVDGTIIKNYHNAKRHNKFTYLTKTIKSFFTYKRSNVKLVVDGKEYHFKNCYLVTVNNGKYIGGGMNICSKAKLDDGLLDVCVVHDCSLLKLLIHFPLVYKGTHLDHKRLKKNVFYAQAKSVEYEADARFFQHDGEYITKKITKFLVKIDE